MQNNQKNEVIPFDFDTHQVRIILIENQPYFINKEICDLLGIVKPDKAIAKLHESQKLMYSIGTSGLQSRRMWLINESALYALLFKSRKPEAQKFQLWVTNEVLPSIRKTGGYNADRVLNPVSVRNQMELNLQPQETIRVIPNELYEELMTIESKPKRMKLMKLYKAIAAKGQTL